MTKPASPNVARIILHYVGHTLRLALSAYSRTLLTSPELCSQMLFWCSLEKVTSEEDEDNDSHKLVFNKSQVSYQLPSHSA